MTKFLSVSFHCKLFEIIKSAVDKVEMEINSLLINLYCHYFKALKLLRSDYKREYPQHVSLNKVLKNTLERITA